MSTSSDPSAPRPIEAALGGLLHDIGKLLQRASGGAGLPERVMNRAEDVLPAFRGQHSHWHALWSDVFFDWLEDEALPWPAGIARDRVRDLAVYHHNPLQAYQRNPDLAATWLVTVADRAASGFERKARDEEQEADDKCRDAFRRTPLDAIQTRIRLPDKDPGTAGRFIPAALSPEAIMPRQSVFGDETEAGYRDLLEGFKAGWRDMARRAGNDPAAFEVGVLDLMERFTWAVPSSTVDQPDVSLFDHSRAVAAFAAALCAHHAARGELADEAAIRDPRRKRLRFLVGDLSGLQRTLFRLKSEQVSGLARILRGRSLRFQLIAEMALQRVLDHFGLPRSCVLQNAGGRFLVLLPDLPDDGARRMTDEVRVEFDDWLAGQYMGDLGLGLALSAPFATGDLSPLPGEEGRAGAAARAREVQAGLRVAIETAKLKQLQKPAADALFRLGWPHGACAACGVRPAREAGGRCAACGAEHELGQRFPKARAVVIRPEGGKTGDAILGGRVILALAEGQEQHDRGLGWRFDEGSHGPAPIRANKPHVPVFSDDPAALDAYAGLEEGDEIAPGNIKTFAALARDGIEVAEGQRLGREMLAVLKADVDHLGAVFAQGLGDEWSIARQGALSRLIDSYFTMRLPALLREHAPELYTVYAGGDDLFLLGPWRQVMDLARHLREDFATFSLHNPSLTLSIGIALMDPRTPISIAATEAEARLEKAKAEGRNRISAIERAPMRHEDYARALEAAERLNRWLRAGVLSTGGLYRFLSFDDARRRVEEGAAKSADYGWIARFGYHLARLLPKREHDPEQRAAAETLAGLFGLDQQFVTRRDHSPGARLAISHALYRNR